ncbi:hypothetical protein Z949_1973 [Sulfitobacter guttiformis KCTC 32187]|nr:hypothetical protein Z949_1973 [Sulfitobacter guttiformis KCTC 32187]
MADGAREFQRGGKPWQKKDGRKPVRDFQRFADAFVLSEHGKLTADEIVLLRGDGDAQGTDKTKTVERDIKKGSVLHGSIEFWWFYFHQSLIRWAASDLSEIAPSRAKECRAALKVELARIKRDEQEPGYD